MNIAGELLSVAVSRAGRVLLFAAEDALHIVRRRLEGICAAAGLALADLDIQVITAPILRLDLDADRRNLAEPSLACCRACSFSIRLCACNSASKIGTAGAFYMINAARIRATLRY
jgi:hypothetical protein